MKLQRKLTAILSLFLTASFCTAAIIISMRINDYNHRLTENLSTQLIESKANEAGAWLAQRIRELHTISRTPTVVSMEDKALKSYVNQLSRDMDSYYGNEYGTFAVNRLDGIEYITENQTIDVSDRDYFREVLFSEAEYVISKPVNSKTDGSLITVACYPIFNKTSEKVGFVAAAISLKKLTELTSNLSFYHGKSLIADSSGSIYTHVDESMPDSFVKNIIVHIPDNSDSGVTYQEVMEENTDYVVFYAPIPNSYGWFLCTAVNRSELFRDTEMLTNSLVGIGLVLLFVAISVSFFISNLATKRICILSGAMQDVRQGNLETSISLNGNDELSDLAEDFNVMVADIKKLMLKVYQQQKEERQRELQVLQSQINPHFLYNTLDTLQWKALEHGAHELSDLIVSLSSFFRISLSKGKEFITLEKELEHVKNYLVIQQFRYRDILEYNIDCDTELYKCSLPKILIQPLVENAIYHGIKPKLGSGAIRISVFEEDNILKIAVKDDGMGMDEKKLNQIKNNLDKHYTGKNYGLYNVSRRIFLNFGENYGLDIESEENTGTTVTVRLPKMMEDTDV